jgi:hypothetical protein
MQREQKWKNWPVLLGGLVLIVLFLLLSHKFRSNKTITNYLADIAGALTAVIISIATYDEWERRQQRKRYLPPEKMGVKRVQEEISQLLYQYAFVLSLRFDPNSKAMRTVRAATGAKSESDKPSAKELKAQTAKHISQSFSNGDTNLYSLSRQALAKPRFKKQTYSEANQLIAQTERTIQQLDLSIETYGYSFTPEIHKWALDLREAVSRAITGKIAVLSIRLEAASKNADKKINDLAAEGLSEIVDQLLAAAKTSRRVKLED